MQEDTGPYVTDHLRRALAQDERTHMLDVSIYACEHSLCIAGTVSSALRRSLVEQVVRELVGNDVHVVNALFVEHYGEPSKPESLG